MARGVNKVILIGNVGQDPEVRYTPSGSAVANISLATSDTWKDRQTGERQERTEWHRLVIFNKTAEVAQQYVAKGSRLYVEGRLQTRKWQDQNGNDRYSTEVVVNDMQMLDSRNAGSGNANAGARTPGSAQGAAYGGGNPYAGQATQSQPQGAPAPGSFDDFDDEIPF